MRLTQDLPIGTNKALLHFLRMLVSGALLAQRDALFPALQALGLGAGAVRRALPAGIMGIAADSGRIGGQRLALPRRFVRVSPHDPSESSSRGAVLRQTGPRPGGG
jgi:hypothetical protein